MANKIILLNIIVFVLIFKISLSFKYPINKKLIDADLSDITAVEVSTRSEFDNYIKNNEYVISIFHADWCGHCKRFLPVFDEASRYKSINNKWKFLKIPCTKYPSICNSFSIDGYPTIKTFKKSNEIKANPPREQDSFLEFLLKVSNSPLVNIESNNKNKFYEDYGSFSPIVEYNPKEKKFFECINNLANDAFLTDYYFGLNKINDKKEKIIFNFDNVTVEFNWNGNCDDASAFLRNNIYPLVSNVNLGLMRQLYRNKKTLFLVFCYSNNEKMNKFVHNSFKNISIDNRKLVFGYSHYNINKDLANYFKINLTKESEIQILIYDFDQEIRYLHPSILDTNILNEKDVENEIRNILKNIDTLPFTSGSKFTDFMRKIGLADLGPNAVILIFVFVLLVLIVFLFIMLFCCDSDETSEEAGQNRTNDKNITINYPKSDDKKLKKD